MYFKYTFLTIIFSYRYFIPRRLENINNNNNCIYNLNQFIIKIILIGKHNEFYMSDAK